MDDRRKRRDARRRKKEQQAKGCLGLVILMAILTLGAAVLWAMGGTQSWTDRLTENPYGPGDFSSLGGYVTCTAGPTRRGIDVSEYQEKIDWAAVKAGGFDFAFIRIGYRGYTNGEIFPDDLARENLAGAKAAGIDVGVYFYSQAVSPEEAEAEARWCLEFLGSEMLDLPLVYDWEWVGHEARTGGMDKATLTECAKTFCRTIENGGYQPMLYFNSHISRDLLDLQELAQYPFWLAQYREKMDYPYQVDFWQYTEEGTVPGIKGKVDIDLMFLYE